MDLESDEKSVGWRKRRDALDVWMKKWVTEVENDISVLSEELFTSEYKDYIKDSLVYELAQDLTEETEFKQNKTRMTAKMRIIRRKPKK
jgi:hypothetical protein